MGSRQLIKHSRRSLICDFTQLDSERCGMRFLCTSVKKKERKKMKSDYFMLMHPTRREQDADGPHGSTEGLICESVHATKDGGGVSLLSRNHCSSR